MAKKKSAADKIIKSLKTAGVLGAVKGKIDDAIAKLQKKIEETRKLFVKSLIAALLSVVGLVFILYGFGLYLQSIARLLPGISFILIGAAAFVIALLVRYVRIGK